MLIVQVTDTHVTRAGEQARYLSDVISWVNSAQPRPAAVLLSGDAVNDGQRDQYAVLREVLGRSSVPVYLVPGNHDRREALRLELPASLFPGASGTRLNFVIDDQPVRLIGLDSSDYRRPGGILDAETLAWLDTTLATAPDRPSLIFMHHPPFRTGVNAADICGFRGLTAFRGIVAGHRAVERIIAGHIHCERHATIGHALATTSVSSVPQRVPELFERRILGLRSEPAGFAVHRWDRDRFSSTTYVHAGNGTFVARSGTDDVAFGSS